MKDGSGSQTKAVVLAALIMAASVGLFLVSSIGANEGDDDAAAMQKAVLPVGGSLAALTAWSVGRRGGSWLPVIIAR